MFSFQLLIFNSLTCFEAHWQLVYRNRVSLSIVFESFDSPSDPRLVSTTLAEEHILFKL